MLLAGSVGLGHEMMARSCAGLLQQAGWRTRCLDSMTLLGGRSARGAERVFGRLVTMPGVYDGLHFAHLRTGSRLAGMMDRAARSRLVPALRTELAREPAGLVLSVFATGASAAAALKAEAPARATVVLCTDVAVHRLWVSAGTDLFLVTSPAAAASVRRYLPRAAIRVVPPPVRPAFYDAPSQKEARLELGVPAGEPCVLLIDSGWGFGPLAGSVAALAGAGVHVLAVAGRNRAMEGRLRGLARATPRIHPFGFTGQVPALMAAADLVITLPGATTCGEARVVGRPLLLLDVMPGHGRDNLLHELETGNAGVCGPAASDIVASAVAMLEDGGSLPPVVPRWEPAFTTALEQIGLSTEPPMEEACAPSS